MKCVTLFKILICMTVTLLSSAFADEDLTISTPQGKLKGSNFKSRDGKQYYAFRGIPYAEKPNRFEVPKILSSWSGTKTANEFGNQCPHFDIHSKTIIGDEDCLFLNVFTPFELSGSQDEKKNLAVMVWFHPGGFEVGRSDDYDAKYFMDEQIVLVTVNYRLGAFGFLSTGDENVPGNMGLWDQNVALQWVQKNIKSFGGDSSRVTIFGNSAGGTSVHLHILSPASTGLFRGGISQSGNVFVPEMIQKKPQLVAKAFGKRLNCPVESMSTLVDCIKQKSVQEIIMAQLVMKEWAFFPFNNFAPVVESKELEHSKFLADDPINLLKSGKYNKVPWINGFTEDDGLVLSTPIILNENFTTDINEDWNRVLPIALRTDESQIELSEKISKFYFLNEEVGEESWDSLTNMFGDRYFIYPSYKSSRLQAKHSLVYQYEFAFPGGPSKAMEKYFGIIGDYGVTHTDELQYLFNGYFGSPEFDPKKDHESLEFSKKFVKLWVSFAENGAPTATWKKSLEWNPVPKSLEPNTTIKNYHIAGETSISSRDKDSMEFWEKLDETYGIDKIPRITTTTTQKIEL